MELERHLDWDGCWNARDLGGLPIAGGRRIRRGALVRSESLNRLTRDGWSALRAHGVRTLIDLRNPEQAEEEPQFPPSDVSTVQVPLEQGLVDDEEFARWGADGWLGTPLYYQQFIERWPDRCARAVEAVSRAVPGGVLVHCGMGRDRTGLIVMLVLSLLGASPEVIEADHGLTAERLATPIARKHGREDDNPAVARVLAREKRSRSSTILDTLRAVDVEERLRVGGLRDGDLLRLRARMADS